MSSLKLQPAYPGCGRSCPLSSAGLNPSCPVHTEETGIIHAVKDQNFFLHSHGSKLCNSIAHIFLNWQAPSGPANLSRRHTICTILAYKLEYTRFRLSEIKQMGEYFCFRAAEDTISESNPLLYAHFTLIHTLCLGVNTQCKRRSFYMRTWCYFIYFSSENNDWLMAG